MLSSVPVREKARQTKIEREKTPHVSTTCGEGSTGATRMQQAVAGASQHSIETGAGDEQSILVLDKYRRVSGLDVNPCTTMQLG
jgi:hypothetical protein